ncbi:MAG: cytochrome c-type biosis protein CcmE [Chloroflexota bacterium]|jgi:cytochrome c-type biogenesis protein CcmE|nr:cytochrome c-type biosis protein CcmE [Chloroflexota bacterium]
MTRPRPVTLFGLGLVVVAFVALAAMSLQTALVYDLTPTELSSHPVGERARLYGIVVEGSVQFDEATKTLRFAVTDGRSTAAVSTQSIPTALFRDGVAVVLAGRLTGPATFAADQLVVKHSEVYAPLEPGETMPPGILNAGGAPP